MANVINLGKLKKAADDRRIATAIATSELADFDFIFNALKEQSMYSVLFKDIDFQKYYNQMMAEVRSKNFTNGEELTTNAVHDILSTYSDRMDINNLTED